MRLSPPKEITFWVCVALAVLALLAFTGTLSILPLEPFWLAFIGLALLIVANMVDGL